MFTFRFCFLATLFVSACSTPSMSSIDAGTGDARTPDSRTRDADRSRDGAVATFDPASLPEGCGRTYPGTPFSSGIVEATGDFGARMMATDFANVPADFAFGTQPLLIRSLLQYMLQTEATEISRAELAEHGAMGVAVAVALVAGNGVLDTRVLRQGFQYFYRCVSNAPNTLAELRARYGDYSTWSVNDVACGRPKNGPRRIWTSPDGNTAIAETLVNNMVRETEVIFANTRTDGQLDFAVYTHEGELSDRSTFATRSDDVTSAAPYTCMACHTADDGSITFRFPTGTGAGCR